MDKAFSKLFEPVQIGGVVIKNRIGMAPMAVLGLTDSEGAPTHRAIDYYVERAKGGVGLIITGAFKVEQDIDLARTIGPIRRTALPSFGELSESIHAFGAKIFVQLTAGLGRVAFPA